MKKTKNSKAFFKSEHKHDNPVLFLDCVCAKISVIHVTTRSENPPISNLFYNKTPKTQQVEGFVPPRKKAEILIVATKRHTSLRQQNNFAFLGCFAKVSVPVNL